MGNTHYITMVRWVDDDNNLIWKTADGQEHLVLLRRHTKHDFAVHYRTKSYWGNIHEVSDWLLENYNIEIVFDKPDADMNYHIEKERRRKHEIKEMNRKKGVQS